MVVRLVFFGAAFSVCLRSVRASIRAAGAVGAALGVVGFAGVGAVGCSSSSDSSDARSRAATTTPGGQQPIVSNPVVPSGGGDTSDTQCIKARIASFGRLAHYGVGNDNTDAFQQWLNTKSTAQMDLFTSRTTLTADLLGNYDIIILQALEDDEQGPFWQFSSDETSALADWVRSGKGLVSLIGYGGNSQEVTGTNLLLGFAGISYNQDDILADCPSSFNGLCYCWGNSVPITDWKTTDAIASAISFNVAEVGAFHGRSIAPGDATVAATDGKGNVVAAAKAVGDGHVFAFADEWVTYTSQWLGTGQQQTINTYDPCYDSRGFMRTADKEFQIPQFWYNVFKWMAPASKCEFKIDNPDIVIAK